MRPLLEAAAAATSSGRAGWPRKASALRLRDMKLPCWSMTATIQSLPAGGTIAFVFQCSTANACATTKRWPSAVRVGT